MFFLFVLITTFLALFLLATGAIGLVVHKVRSGFMETRRYAYDITAREFLNVYLFSDIEPDPAEQPELYQERLLPLLAQLRTDLRLHSASRSNPRRRSLKRVALTLSSEVIGETRIRMTRLFDHFGFVDDLIPQLADSAWWVRANACRTAGLMRAEPALPLLERLLDDENEDVRIEAAQAMLDIAGVAGLAPVLMRLRELSLWMQVRLSRTVLEFRGDAVPHLVVGIRSEHPQVQGFCIDLLGMIGDVSAVPVLLEYISFEVPAVQRKSLIAFGRIGDERAVPVIQRFLGSEDRELRLAAARAAANLASPAIAYHLHALLLKDDTEVRLAAAEALARSGETGVKSLLYASRVEDRSVRLIALQFLHDLGVVPSGEGGAA